MAPSQKTDITSIRPEALESWMSEHEELIIIDVRSAAEFETLHIRGSYNVPLALLTEHTEELAARLGSRVVLVCQSGVRAEQARQRLATVGLETAYVLSSGVPGFSSIGGDVVKGKSRWGLERQVRLVAGSLVLLGLTGGKVISPKFQALTGVIGTGLAFSAATDTCAMGRVLSAMPWNRATVEPSRESAIQQLPLHPDSESTGSPRG